MIKNDLYFLKLAINQAKKSVKLGGFPAGAVLVLNNKVITKGVSLGFLLHDPTSHAETSTIRKACKRQKTTNLRGSILYASLQPCLMCFSVCNWAGVSKIIFACRKNDDMVKKNYYEGSNNLKLINKNNNRSIDLKFLPGFENEMLKIIKNWENKN